MVLPSWFIRLTDEQCWLGNSAEERSKINHCLSSAALAGCIRMNTSTITQHSLQFHPSVCAERQLSESRQPEQKGGEIQDIGLAVIPNNNSYKSRLTMVVLLLLKSPSKKPLLLQVASIAWLCTRTPDFWRNVLQAAHGSPPRIFCGAGRRAIFSGARKSNTCKGFHELVLKPCTR